MKKWLVPSSEVCIQRFFEVWGVEGGLLNDFVIIVVQQTLINVRTPERPITGLALKPPVREGARFEPPPLRVEAIRRSDVSDIGK